MFFFYIVLNSVTTISNVINISIFAAPLPQILKVSWTKTAHANARRFILCLVFFGISCFYLLLFPSIDKISLNHNMEYVQLKEDILRYVYAVRRYSCNTLFCVFYKEKERERYISDFFIHLQLHKSHFCTNEER